MLNCIRQLVNGTTIRQELNWAAVDYYHVELDEHAILVAAGLPAASYLDTGNRGFFSNSGAPLALHPNLTNEVDYPTREEAPVRRSHGIRRACSRYGRTWPIVAPARRG